MYATVCLVHVRMCFIPLHVLTISTRGHNSHELSVVNIRLCLCLCQSFRKIMFYIYIRVNVKHIRNYIRK